MIGHQNFGMLPPSMSLPNMQNQNYGMYQQQQPYQQQYQQQNYQQQQNQFNIQGKVVDSKAVVDVTDIPMDNNSYYFPKADGTEIYVKKWLPNCQTKIVVFKPVLEEEVQEQQEVKITMDDVMEKLNGMYDKMDKIEKTIYQRQNNNVNKKREDLNNA